MERFKRLQSNQYAKYTKDRNGGILIVRVGIMVLENFCKRLIFMLIRLIEIQIYRSFSKVYFHFSSRPFRRKQNAIILYKVQIILIQEVIFIYSI